MAEKLKRCDFKFQTSQREDTDKYWLNCWGKILDRCQSTNDYNRDEEMQRDVKSLLQTKTNSSLQNTYNRNHK